MGEYLPFLFAIAYVIYGFYNNLKKAQEEAKKRNPSQPWEGDRPEEKAERPKKKQMSAPPSRPVYSEPEPVLVREVYNQEHYEPKYESVYQQPDYAEYVKPKIPKKKKSAIPTSVSISDRINHNDEIEHGYEFDMRDAVIKKAILDRPPY